jgi:hypothetical protein
LLIYIDDVNDESIIGIFRLKELTVSVDQVKAEQSSSGGLFKEIFEAADLYGVFEDLYGRDKFFRCQ